MQGFRYDANPMGMLVASVGALSTFYPDANKIHEERVRAIQIIRLLAKMPTLAAFAFRHNMGQPYVYPDNDLDYAGNFLSMMYKMTELKYEPDPRLARALDVLFILHADHEQNASTSAVRAVGSTQVDPYSAVAAGVAALYGPLHGGANEAALRMLARIEKVENIPDFLEGVKAGNERLMGFGHRVYKNYDPRARIIRKHLDDVFEVRGKSPLLEVAIELEKRALDDDYFTSRKLYPNVDFYSGLIYEALGLPVAMFPVMFAIGRTSGWIAQWKEMVEDPEQKIARPRQIYTGERDLTYVPDRAALATRSHAAGRCLRRIRRLGRPGARGDQLQDQRGAVGAQPLLRLAIARQPPPQQRPEAGRVVEDLEMAHLVPDHVLEHPLGRQQQAPVEAHVALRRARPPAGALTANRQAVVREAHERRGRVQPRLDLRPRRPPVEALQRRPTVADRHQQALPVSVHPRAPTLWHQPQRRPEIGHRPGPLRHPCERRFGLAHTSLDPRSQLPHRRRRRPLGGPLGQHHLHTHRPTLGQCAHVHPHPPRPRRAPDRVGDLSCSGDARQHNPAEDGQI